MKSPLKAASYSIATLALLLGRYPISWLLSGRNSATLKAVNQLNYSGRYIKSATGNLIYVKRAGRPGKPTLVFIHGINSSSEQWQHQQQHFRNDYELLLIDLPGHGASGAPTNLSITALATDLACVLRKMNSQHPILYGHSIGGIIIQEYCRRKLEPLPKAIILQNCSYTNPLKTMPISPVPWLLQNAVIRPALNKISKTSRLFSLLGCLAYTSGLSSILYRFLLFSGTQSGATLRTMASFAAKTSATTTAQMLLHSFDFEAGRDLKKIDIPCLILAAEYDRLVDPDAAVHLHRQIPGSELKVLPGGHQTLAEYPQATNQAIRHFLEKMLELQR